MLFFRQLFSPDKLNLLRKCYSQNVINLSDSATITYLKHLMVEHDNLHTKGKRTPCESKRLFELKPIVNLLEQRITLLYDNYNSIESLKELNKKQGDSDMKKMIKEEAQIYLKRIAELQTIQLEPQLTDGEVLLEVTADADGQEAMLFAQDLVEMYESYARYKDWEINIISLEKSDIGGIKNATMVLEGFGVPELMKMEAGVHHVQRIPATDKGVCSHTSTVSVVVFPQPSDIELNIPERDIVIETKQASGAGGQHVNMTDSAVRIIHTPTGTVVECQGGGSLIKNEEIAMQKLRTLLLEKQHEEHSSKNYIERKSQIGSSNKNEKIRTYNFSQDQVIEHREGGGIIHNLQGFMQGGDALQNLQESLLRQQKHQALLEDISQFVKKQKVEIADNNQQPHGGNWIVNIKDYFGNIKKAIQPEE